jgi:hypothetical protein
VLFESMRVCRQVSRSCGKLADDRQFVRKKQLAHDERMPDREELVWART